MSEETNGNPDAPARPPLRAVFMVWPGQSHGQTWMFLWLGVAYLIGGLLPWHGANDVELMLAQPYEVTAETQDGDGKTVPAVMSTSLSAVHYRMAVENNKESPSRFPNPPSAVIGVREPGMGFGAFLVLLSAVTMCVAGVVSVWNRRLALTPVLCTWFVGLAVLYFSSGYRYSPQASGGERFTDPETISNGFAAMGAVFGAVFGNFGDLVQGNITAEVKNTFDAFGMGFYVTMCAQIFLVGFIVFSIVSGAASSKKDAPAAGAGGGSSSRRPRPGGGGFPANGPGGVDDAGSDD